MTTIAPTTLGSTSLAPTTAVPEDVIISCGAIEVEIAFYFWPHYFPPATRDATLDYGFSPGAIEVEVEITGGVFNIGLAVGPIETEIEVIGGIVIGQSISAGPIEVEIVPFFSYMTLDDEATNTAIWSKIGYFNFIIDQSNLAGRRVMDWKGAIHHIKKLLPDKVVVYGANGVTVMKAHERAYGMTTIHRVGVVGRGAVAGDDTVHFFVDRSNSRNRLWKLTDELEKLDYSEYLSLMGDMVLSYDRARKLLYICDGTYGYVYSQETKSFGEGPVNVTGIDYQSNQVYVVSPTPILTPKFEIHTDIYDFGTRKPKTIERMEVGTDLTENLYSSVEYRTSYRDDFRQIGWHLVNPDGKSFPKCYGVEFRFWLKSFMYEYLELDYWKIKGHIHGYSALDTASETTNLLAKSLVGQ